MKTPNTITSKMMAVIGISLWMLCLPAQGADTADASMDQWTKMMQQMMGAANGGATAPAQGYGQMGNMGNMMNPMTMMNPMMMMAPMSMIPMQGGGHPAAAMMNPQNWMQPNTYMNMMNPSSMGQYMNPMSYMTFMNPGTYMPLMNPGAYTQMMMQAMNPATYTKMAEGLMKPEAYGKWYEDTIKQLEQAGKAVTEMTEKSAQ